MPEKFKSALIVASPGPFRDSLRALVTTMSHVEMVAEVSSVTSFIDYHKAFQPDLVLVDGDEQDEGILNILAAFQSQHSRTRICVLVDGETRQTQPMDKATYLVLPKGYPAANLADMLEEILGGVNVHE